jgi:hypothetical protein
LSRAVEKTPGVITLLAPAVDLDLSAGAGVVEWPVAKPVDLSKTHGIEITLERLAEMAEAYDPEAVEAAPINFDHAAGGQAHGWIARAFVRDGLLWVSPVDLSAEMVDGIKGQRYKRASIELTTNHPETGGWYLNGLAVLGNAKPAIKALPPLRLSAPRWVLQLGAQDVSQPDEPATLTPSEDPEEELTMSDKKPEASGAKAGATSEEGLFRRLFAKAFGDVVSLAMSPAEKGDEGAEMCPSCKGSGYVVEAPEKSEESEGEAKSVAASQSRQSVDVAALVAVEVAKATAGHRVEADLASLAGKATPGAIAKARPALLKAAAAGDTDTYGALLGVLGEQDASALLGGPIATPEQTAAGHTGLSVAGTDLAWLEANGVKAGDVARLENKYGRLNRGSN